MFEVMGLVWRPHRVDHAWHGRDDHGTYTARVIEPDGRWRAYLTATNQQLAGDHPTATAAMVAVDQHLAQRVRRPAPGDIHQDIRTLRRRPDRTVPLPKHPSRRARSRRRR
jgi:hypothetical protein